MDYHEVQEILGNEAESLHGFNSPKISKDLLHKPSSCSIEQIFALSNRNLQVQVLTYPAKYDHVRQSQGWLESGCGSRSAHIRPQGFSASV